MRFLVPITIFTLCTFCFVRDVQSRIDLRIDQYLRTKSGQPLIVRPDPEKCLNRPETIFFKGHGYAISVLHPEINKTVGWLEGRNLCRQYCMDLISLETEEEYELVKQIIEVHSLPYIWTSGHVCDFPECKNKKDMHPLSENGWFWTATMEKIPATSYPGPFWNYIPWSQAGYFNETQPDDAEFTINGTHESCLAILHNVYKDGIQWHDVGCYHQKPIICEDNDELLRLIGGA